MSGHRMIRVSGHVQGVYFRASARREALRLGLTGFARNDPDGSVVIEVEGDEEAIARFVAWCHEGPPRARIERVQVAAGEPVGYTDFTVR